MDTYECITCKRTETIEDEDYEPDCCGKPMKKKVLREICLQPSHAEHARPMDEETACDEFRGG